MYQNHAPVDKSKGVVRVGHDRKGEKCSKTMHLSTNVRVGHDREGDKCSKKHAPVDKRKGGNKGWT